MEKQKHKFRKHQQKIRKKLENQEEKQQFKSKSNIKFINRINRIKSDRFESKNNQYVQENKDINLNNTNIK